MGVGSPSTARAPLDRRRIARAIVFALLVLAVWLAHYEPPIGVPGDNLDNAWASAMTHFLAEGARAGTDWMFTTGPLSGLTSPIYEPRLFAWKIYAWEGVWRLCAAGCLVLATVRVEGRIERALCAAFLVLATIQYDAWSFATLFAAAAVLDDPERPPRRIVEWIVLVAIGGAALAKFTVFVATVVLIGALVVARASRSGPRAGGALLLRASAVLLAAWFAAGQTLADVGPWIGSAVQLASAYSEAQSTPARDPAWRTLGLAGVALLATALALSTRSERVPRARIATALGLAFVAFCAWKAGFVRASDHTVIFFTFLPVAAAIVPAPRDASSSTRVAARAARFAAFVVGCIGLVDAGPSDGDVRAFAREASWKPDRVGRALTALSDPVGVRRALEQGLVEERARSGLPLIRERVGGATVDILGFRQGLMLLDGLAWTPRPVFQSYVTFTRELQQRNADFLAGPRAPRFLVSRHETIDDRWPPLDDALALEIVARDYVPVLREREYMLLERRADAPRTVEREVVVERTLRFGERLELPRPDPRDERRGAYTLTLDVRSTAAGVLARVLESTPELRIVLHLDDGTARSGRIVPATMRARVLVDPIVQTNEQWIDWMLGRELPRCTAIVIEPPARGAWHFEPELTARVEHAIGGRPARTGFEAPPWARGLARVAPDLEFLPRGARAAELDGLPVVVVDAPSRIVWTIDRGTHRVAVRYGILPELADGRPTTTGEFAVVETAPGRAHVHLRRAFESAQLARLGIQTFETTIVAAEPVELVLATTLGKGWTGPDARGVETGCYWAALVVERMEGGAR